jgi:hypothetical protein
LKHEEEKRLPIESQVEESRPMEAKSAVAARLQRRQEVEDVNG